MDVQWDADKNIEVQELWKQTYPRDFVPRTNLSARYCAIGQFEKALEEARESLRLNPDAGVAYAGVALSSMCLNRYDDAKAALEQAISRKLQPPQYRYMLYSIALLKGDADGMQQQVEAVAGTPIEPGMLAVQAVTAAASGRLGSARELTTRAVDLSLRLNMKEAASQHTAVTAIWEAALGNCAEAKSASARALAIERGRYVLSWSALALALCGETLQTQSILDEMGRRFPNGSFIKTYWAPMARAAIELNRNNSSLAIQLLEPSSRGETGTNPALWPAYLRGLAYLRQRAGKEASGEFQKIVDHRGMLALAPGDFTPAGYSLYPLAHLGLARASAIAGDVAKSRKEYEAFIDSWKDADSNSPLLATAKQEYSR
jgi:tetratricopeptide (TPR) repeat protein